MIFKIVMSAVVVGFLGLLFWAVPTIIERDRRAEQAADPGCEMLGYPKYLSSVYFYDCNGEIKMKRIK